MRVLLYVLGIIFIPLPAFQHFIWPISSCVLADICNHTWIPECGAENLSGYVDYRMFIDECDMHEYNCDYERSYAIVNYSLCYQPATGCPTFRPKNFYRMGNYRFVLDGRRLIYDPTTPTTNGAPPVPLPSRMLHGKRRYTPEGRKRNNRFLRLGISSPCGGCHTRNQTINMKAKRTFKRKSTRNNITLKKTTPMTYMRTKGMSKVPYFDVIYKRLTVIKDGKVMVKVVKGTATTITTGVSIEIVNTEDSDFLQ